VQARTLAEPEFDHIGDEAIATPERRPRHVGAGVALFRCSDARVELGAIGQRLRLLRCPCTDAAFTRTRGEIGIGLLGIRFADHTFDAHLDDITQKNAQMVDQTSSASAGLGERARQLASAVGGFRLRQGTADEAQALVERAVMHFRGHGGRGSLAAITSADGGFHDRDMYVFAWDRELVYHAFAGKPHNVGKNAQAIIGTDTTQLRADVWDAAARGGGWVDYDFLNPANGQIAPKTSFVLPVDDDLVLGCGIYKTVARPVTQAA